jgi:hypothetical protein
MTEELLTYRDAYEHLTDVYGITGSDQGMTVRNLRRAITEAYRRLPVLKRWAYFTRTTMVQTDATYTTGTIAYSTITGQVTLTTGTWPANATFGDLIISDVSYKIARRISDTIIELDAASRPALTVAAGTSYRWARFRYLLPIDVGDIREVIDSQYENSLIRSNTQDIFWGTATLSTESYPSSWAMTRSLDYPGRWEIWLSSAETSARELRIQYDARFTSLPIEEISAGTITTVADVVTFTSAILTEDCVGCVLRIATNTDKPTPRVGSYINDDVQDVVRLPANERVITQFTNATTAVINRSLPSDVTGVAYSLSSHIDLNPSLMWELFMRLCEQQYDIITRADHKTQALSRNSAQEALRAAAIADGRRIESIQGRGGRLPTVSNDSVT